jgi:hypothetical protein
LPFLDFNKYPDDYLVNRMMLFGLGFAQVGVAEAVGDAATVKVLIDGIAW